MALFDFIKKQFIDVIEWTETENGVLAYRFPMQDAEIQTGARLTVRDSQGALFVNEGQIADAFAPGLYKLSTHTLPLLTNLMNWDKLFQSPFKSDVYFFSTRDQVDQKWGTPTPVTIRDKDFGAIRIRAHGIFSYRITDVKAFYKAVSGTREKYMASELSGQLHSTIVSHMGQYFAGSQVAFVDMAANQVKFSDALKEYLRAPFGQFGLELRSFFVQSISLPEELQERFDKMASMNMLGDMQRYTRFQTAESIPVAAANTGGLAGAGVGLGAGLGIGQTMAAAMAGAMTPAAGGAATGGGASESADAAAALEKVHDLFKKGILSQEEFDAKKAELLKKIQ